eukprot:gene18392-22011_t
MSTIESIYKYPNTTCNNLADASSYWAPALKINGIIVPPLYMKTYYQSRWNIEHPVVPFKRGHQLISGNPTNTVPQPYLWFFCGDGQKFSNTIFKTCRAIKTDKNGDGIGQFIIQLDFPDCWDGKEIRPTMMYKNAVHSVEGACPSDYPIRLPVVNLRIVYKLVNIEDFSDFQLSINPTVHSDGSLNYLWAGPYSAHADFFNGWPEQSMEYAVERCLNKQVGCNREIPRAFTRSSMSFAVINDRQKVMGADPMAISNTSVPFFRFPLPDKIDGDWTEAYVETYSANLTPGASSSIHIFAITEENFNSAIPVCPKDGRIKFSSLNNDHKYRPIDLTGPIKEAMARGDKALYLCYRGVTEPTHVYDTGSAGGKNEPYLKFMNLIPNNPDHIIV